MSKLSIMAGACLAMGAFAGRGIPLPDPAHQRPYTRKPLSNRERKLQEKNAKKRRAAK